MKYAILILAVLVALVAAGSAAPTMQVSPASSKASACLQAVRLQNSALHEMSHAATYYSQQILPAYKAGLQHSSVSRIIANMNRGTAKVKAATALVRKATPLAAICASGG